MSISPIKFLRNYFIIRPENLDVEERRVFNLRAILMGLFFLSILGVMVRGVERLSWHYIWPAAAIGIAVLPLLALLKLWPRQRTMEFITFVILSLNTVLVAVRGGPMSLYAGMIPIVVFISILFLSPGGVLRAAIFAIAGYSFTIIGQIVGWIPSPVFYTEREALMLGFFVGNGFIALAAIFANLVSQAFLHRRHQVESTLHRYRNLVDSAPDPIIVWDPKGRITMANHTACKALGYQSENDLVGKTGADIVPPDRLEEGNRNFRKDIRTMRPSIREFEFIKSDGERFPIELHMIPIEENDQSVGLLGICRDVSDRLRAERERSALHEKLVMHDKMASLGRLILGIAHEYNNILAGLRAYAQLAQIPGKENRLRELPDVAIDLVDRAQNVTEGLLNFSEKFEPDIHWVKLAELVDGIAMLMRKDFEQAGIRVETHIPQNVEIVTDASKLQQVLLNLISNAREAMVEGGTIRIRYASDENTHSIEVEDEGKGIPAEDLPKIFDPFYTTKGPLAAGGGQSVGLGLSVCYSLIQGLGGEIVVESAEGGGSTFKIVLPCSAPETE